MQEIFKLYSSINEKYIYTLLLIVLLIFTRWLLHKIIKKRVDKISQRYKWYKIVTYSVVFIGIFLVVPRWIKGFSSFYTFLGLFSAGLAIALRDIISNFFGWIYIMSRRPFATGDRIEINNIKGDVIVIKIMDFSLMEVGNWVDGEQSTGRIINIPNGKILNNEIANFTKGFELIWNEISVLITFESDWEEAKSVLEKIAIQNSASLNKELREKIIHSARKEYQNLTPIVYTTVKSSGVCLTVRYLCEPRKRRLSSENFWEKILSEFKKRKSIDFAYKTFRYYNRNLNNSNNESSEVGKGKKSSGK